MLIKTPSLIKVEPNLKSVVCGKKINFKFTTIYFQKLKANFTQWFWRKKEKYFILYSIFLIIILIFFNFSRFIVVEEIILVKIKNYFFILIIITIFLKKYFSSIRNCNTWKPKQICFVDERFVDKIYPLWK